MPIDFDNETVAPLSQAARELPVVRGTKTPHPATLYRWATVGIKSCGGQTVILETAFVGGTRVTSKEALSRFFARKNDVRFRGLPDAIANEQQQLERQADAAMQRMQAARLV